MLFRTFIYPKMLPWPKSSGKYLQRRRLLIKEAAFFCLLIAAFFIGVAKDTFALEISEETKEFAVNNPDGQKYDFVKTYLMALEYLYQNEQAKAKLQPLDEETIKRTKSLAKVRDHLKNANINLRIARNLLENFKNQNNAMMMKIVSLFGKYADEETALNNRHRTMVSILYESSLTNRVSSVKRRWYSQHLTAINESRKANAAQLLEASMLISKLLVSNQFNRLGKFDKLGISAVEREKLIDRLATFQGEEFQGELRPGQSYLQASIASIREILQNTNWPSL